MNLKMKQANRELKNWNETIAQLKGTIFLN